MGLIGDKKVKDFKWKANEEVNCPTTEQISIFPKSYIYAAFNDGINKGIEFSETEFQDIMLKLIQSIFKYERESLETINSYDRTPEQVLKKFIIKYKSIEP